MTEFRRAHQPGGTFFFTVITYDRRPIFRDRTARSLLRFAISETQRRRPFEIDAIVLLPDHLHVLWTQPPGDSDFSTRWRKIKESFTRSYLASGGHAVEVTPGQARKSQAGVWQPRFWEHVIRDDVDFRRHVDYIHFNPVKHSHATCPHAWEWSSFARWVRMGVYERDWCCACDHSNVDPPDFSGIAGGAGE